MLDSYIIEEMKSVVMSAFVLKNSEMFADKTDKSEVLCVLSEGCFVQIYNDHSAEWYYVGEILTGQKGWVRRECLEMPPETEVDAGKIGREVVERYVNLMEFKSVTNYLIFIDISRQKVYAFHGGENDWTLIKTLSCSTGKIETPTIRGVFKISERGEWFYSERLGSGGKHWMRFSGTYLLHSQAMDRSRRVLEIDNEIGKRVSNGCVRFYPRDVEWVYRNVPDGTTVVVH